MLWTIVVMAALNVLMVVLTLKTVRIVNRRGLEARSGELEAALDDLILTGDAAPILLRPRGRDMDLLATRMAEYLSLLSGEQRERLVGLAEEADLATGISSGGSARATAGGRPRPPSPWAISAARLARLLAILAAAMFAVVVVLR